MNAGRLQLPFGQEGGGKVPEPLDGDEFGHGRMPTRQPATRFSAQQPLLQ